MTNEELKPFVDKLKSCPWCKKKPSIEERANYRDFAVKCLTITCPVLPSTWYYDTPGEAVAEWNKGGTDG